jgi:hypothetical protein
LIHLSVFSSKFNFYFIDVPKEAPTADPWGGSTNANSSGHDWAQFDKNNTNSSFGTTAEWPQTTTVSNENSSTG